MLSVPHGCPSRDALSASTAAWTFFVFRLLTLRRRLAFLWAPLPLLTTLGKVHLMLHASRVSSARFPLPPGPSVARRDAPVPLRTSAVLLAPRMDAADSTTASVSSIFSCSHCLSGQRSDAYRLKPSSNQYGDFMECLTCGQRWRRMTQCCGLWIEIGRRSHAGAKPPTALPFCRAHIESCTTKAKSPSESPRRDGSFQLLC